MSEEADPSQSEAQRLAELFGDVELPVITGIDFNEMSPKETAALLPSFGGRHPAKGILIDKKSGHAYGIASGWKSEEVTHKAITYKSGSVSMGIAAEAGLEWELLGNHIEAVAAALMRKAEITDAVLVINSRNPCWGKGRSPGCYYSMKLFLAENSKLSVYNKDGMDFAPSFPDRKFHFVGEMDKKR